MTKMEILNRLEKGELSFKEALSLIEEQKKPEKISRGHFLKVHITSGQHSIPIVLPLFLIGTGFSIGKTVMRFIPQSKLNDEVKQVCKVLDLIDPYDIWCLVEGLKRCKDNEFIEIVDGDDRIEIKVI